MEIVSKIDLFSSFLNKTLIVPKIRKEWISTPNIIKACISLYYWSDYWSIITASSILEFDVSEISSKQA